MTEPRRTELSLPLVRRSVSPSAEEAEVSVEDGANCFSRITFSWVGSIISLGYNREWQRARGESQGPAALTEEDLLCLRQDDVPRKLSQEAHAAWQAHSPSLIRSLRQAFGGPYLFAACFKLIYDSLQMAGPYILKDLLNYLSHCNAGKGPADEGECTLATGMMFVLLILGSAALQTTVLHQYFHRCLRTGMRLNASIISLVYGKALRIAGAGKDESGEEQRTTGEIVNLMSVDSQRLQDAMTYMHTLWSGPYQITITLIFLYFVVGWSMVAGVMVMLLQIPAVTVVARSIRLAQRKLMSIKDNRIKITNEMFGSIRLLKMYGWEDSFESRLDGIREKELKQLRTYQILQIISSAMWATAPILTALATFAVYSASYGELMPATAFTAVSLFNVLRFPLTMFPNTITSAVEANVSVKRLEKFLVASEISGRTNDPTGEAVVVQDAELKWPNGTPLLSPMSFAVPAPVQGQSKAHLTVVLGAVGTGKFAGEYLKIPGACQAADSPRIRGVAHDMILTRRPRVRADMLTPVMVCWLEVACFALPSAYDRAIAGFCMYCIFGRLRCADANRTRHSSLLGRFVEGALSRTKTTRSKEKASSFIPLVVPSFGFLAKPWYLEFLRARQELGLAPVPPLASLAHNLEFLILPGYASLGYETAERVGSAEVSDRLRSILAKGFEADALERITSHSLKTTLLAYCNMFGVSLEQSELLGYHVNKEHQSALNYTRDSLCAPIRALIDVMRAVHVGAFVPGAPRDSMFPDATACRRVEDAFAAELGMTVLEAAESMQ
ncbi:ABC transporter C family member 8 (ABC transporter ABCC.8), partial [Durusdinium trenchii]